MHKYHNIPMEDKLDWGKYVSPVADKNNPPFNWYSFKHSFSSQLVSNLISLFNLKKGDYILDPFCGGGTTLIKSKMMGYNSVGLDISPFSIFLTNTVTTKYNTNRLKKALTKISHEIDRNVAIPEIDILKKAFSINTLKYIYSLKKSINSLDNPENSLFLLCLLSILDKTSKARKSGGFLRITDNKKVPWFHMKNIFMNKSLKLIDEFSNIQYNDVFSKSVLGDARQFPDEIENNKFDAIITSPPYPNRHDYTRIYELELLIGFINHNDELKKLRYNTLRSHVEARKKFDAVQYVKPSKLYKLIERMNDNGTNNPRITGMLEGYFEDMYLVMSEMLKKLKDKGKIALVISNVRFAGVNIPVDEILSEIGNQVGLKPKAIWIARYRGNSSQQMKEYKRKPSRESIVFWEK